MQLNLIQPPASEIITLDDTKTYLRVDHDYDNNLILNLIKATREAIEAIIQKSILKQVWQYTLDNDAVCKLDFGESNFPSISGNLMQIPLPKPPVTKIVNVTVDGVEYDRQKYHLELVNNQFCLCLSCKGILGHKRKVSITIVYEAGIADTAENVPYQLKLANLMLVANAYQERFSYKSHGFMSSGVRQLLNPFLNFRIM